MLRIGFCFIIALSFTFSFAHIAPAQQPPDPPPSMDRNLNEMAGQIGVILGQSMRATLTELSKPETAALLAKFQKQHFDALIKEGFTREEAIRIVCATQSPLITK